MTTNQIKDLATKVTQAALTAYILRPDKEGRENKSFLRGFGSTKVQQLAVAAAESVLSAVFADTVTDAPSVPESVDSDTPVAIADIG